MQGNSVRQQKNIARQMGYDPDAVYDPNTGKSIPLDIGLTAPAAVFTNQGVPMTQGKYGPPPVTTDADAVQSEGKVEFNQPTHRSESANAPFPGKHGDPYAGFGSGGK